MWVFEGFGWCLFKCFVLGFVLVCGFGVIVFLFCFVWCDCVVLCLFDEGVVVSCYTALRFLVYIVWGL